MSEFDYLDGMEETAAAKARNDAIDYAQLYVATFVDNPAGARLLADWDARLLHKRIPVNAPHTEYAAVSLILLAVSQLCTSKSNFSGSSCGV